MFVVDMENSATVVSRLSEQQLQDAYDNGIDMFFTTYNSVTEDIVAIFS